MNEFFKKLFNKAGALWARWSTQQRIIFAVIAVVILGGVVTLFRVSSTPVLVSVLDFPINNEDERYRIVARLNEENVGVVVSANNMIQVADAPTARRMRNILIVEGLIPNGIDPWQIFDRERWTLTDFERNVNFQRAQERMILEHIRAVDGVDNASITIAWPKRELFLSDQNPVKASVIITPKHGSDITTDIKKIEGIHRLLKYAIDGLSDENIFIADRSGLQLNDFDGLRDFERLTQIEREAKIIRDMEKWYKDQVLNSLQGTFSANRVRFANIKIDMDMSRRSVDRNEILPITIRPRTPGLPYDDSEIRETIVGGISRGSTIFEGTGFMPEGPAGVEGQMPPAFRDMSNLYGRVNQSTETINYEWNTQSVQEERSPSIDRVTLSVNIDGRWRWKYDAKGNPVILEDGTIEREYTPVPPEDLRNAERLIQNAIGYNSARGDSVTVTNIPFDRTEEFKAEDAEYFRQKQIQTTIIVFLSGLILLLIGFILFRMVSREMERRRRLAEEERARREQQLRESAMAEAEAEGMDVSISMEERTRMELMESAINMAKEHPEDAAQLIRTWLLEE